MGIELTETWNDIHALAAHLKNICSVSTLAGKDVYVKNIVVTSGGFDPLTIGHTRCILSSATYGELVVIVNGDDFLLRKKGYVFMPLEERMEIIASLQGVSHVVSWDDGTQYVDKALAILRPHYFTKGGDRSTIDSIAEPEKRICENINCRIVLGVGGCEKVQSSSALVEQFKQREDRWDSNTTRRFKNP